jgi:hypothetical protein
MILLKLLRFVVRQMKSVLYSRTRKTGGIGAFLIRQKTQGIESEQSKVYRAVRDAVQQKIEEELFVKDRNRKP